jgi:hypothetical protein
MVVPVMALSRALTFAWGVRRGGELTAPLGDGLRPVLLPELHGVIDGLEEGRRVTALSDLSDVT